MQDPQYQMREDHPDPHMRPSVDHLISQLRRHKALKDRPDNVAFIIKDLSHRFLVRDDQRPDLLWQAIRDLMFHFEHLMPPAGQDGFEWVEEQMDKQAEFFPTEESREQLNNIMSPVPTYAEAVASGEIVEVGRVIRFDDQFLKDGIVGVIVRHRGHEYVQGKVKCRCTKFFSSPEEWANHVRIRIWRFFKNEFPPIPSTDEDSELHQGETGEGGNPDSNGNQQVPVPVQLEEPATT